MPSPSRRIAAVLPALLVAAATTALAATAATTAAAATTTTTADTTATTTTTTPANGTVIRTWTFEDSYFGAWAPIGAAPLSVTPAAARTGNLGLQIGLPDAAASYGQGIGITMNGPNFADNVWYDINVPIRLAPGAPSTRYLATGPDGFTPASLVSSTGWSTVTAHFRKLPGQSAVNLTLTSVNECATDPVPPASTAFVDDITVRVAYTQAAITYTKLPCPAPSTTTAARTTTTTTTSTSPGPSRCRVTYSVVSQWTGSFQGSARLTNTSASVIPTWVLGWTFQDGQQVTQSWGTGGYQQSGATASFTAPGWAPNLAAGASADIGFIGTWSGQNRPPIGITVNGEPCESSPTTTTTTTTTPATTTTSPPTTTTTAPTTTTTTNVTRRDGCSYLIAFPGQGATGTTSTTTRTSNFDDAVYLYITGYGLVGQYPDGTVVWVDDHTQVSGVRGATSWSQTGRTLSLAGLQWTVGDVDHVTLVITGRNVSTLPASVAVGGVPCSRGW